MRSKRVFRVNTLWRLKVINVLMKIKNMLPENRTIPGRQLPQWMA